jgi:hypothetical protein
MAPNIARIPSFLSGILIGLIFSVVAIVSLAYFYIDDDFFDSPLEKMAFDTLISKPLAAKTAVVVNSSPTKNEIENNLAEIEVIDLDTNKTINETESDLVIVQDKLLQTKKVLIIKAEPNFKLSKVDSLLNVFEDSPSNENETMLVEFWKSPVNYRGFKMLKNRLIVYGIDHESNIGLFLYKGKLFLKTVDHFYKLYPTDQFELLTIADDEVKNK